MFVELWIIGKIVLLFIDFMYFTRWPYNLVHPFFCLFSKLAPYFSDFLHEMENLFLPRFGKKEPQNRVFWFFKNFFICFSKQQCKMKFLVILVFPLQTSCLANFLFWSCFPNCFWPIRFQNSLKCNIPGKIEESSWFFSGR